jgi:hypothetical protein
MFRLYLLPIIVLVCTMLVGVASAQQVIRCEDGQCQPSNRWPTHINGVPVAQPRLVTPSTFAASAGESVDMGDRGAFRRQFVVAVRKAREAGDLTFAQSLTIRLAMANPKVMDHLQGALASEAIAVGAAKPSKVDWNSLLGFLKQVDWQELLKFIAELVKLFAVNGNRLIVDGLCICSEAQGLRLAA